MCVLSAAPLLLLLLEQHSVQVWVGEDILWLLNNSVIYVGGGLSSPEASKVVVAGNCSGGRLGITLGWSAFCRPSHSFSPFHPGPPRFYPLICPSGAGTGIV